jgi:hypothetical protein
MTAKPVPKAQSVEDRLNALIGSATAWADMGSMSNGWSVGTHARYRKTMDGLLVLAWRALSVGTETDGTVIWSAANGLPAGFRPVNNNHIIVAATDHMASPGGLGSESATVVLNTDGSVTIQGFAGSGNSTRCDVCGTYPIDD